jgi:hypothetical protein
VILHNGKEVTKGTKNEKTGYGMCQLQTTVEGNMQSKVTQNGEHCIPLCNTRREETIQFLHQCMFSPTIETLCKAIDNNQLIGFPTIMSALVQKYLPESTTMAKGHMNQTRKGFQSTTKRKQHQTGHGSDFNPLQVEEAELELFIGATITQQSDGAIYTDQTGNFPI